MPQSSVLPVAKNDRLLHLKILPWILFYILFVFLLKNNIISSDEGFGLDADNNLRASQILDFLRGGAWFDTANARLGLEGADVYARLIDIPYILIAKPLSFFMPLQKALLAAAYIVPFFLLMPLYLFLSAWSFRPLVGEKWSYLAFIPAVFSGHAAGAFMPGHIDHHNAQILIFLFLLGLLTRLWTPGVSLFKYNGLLFSLGTAFSLSIGIETAPYLAVLFATLSLRVLMDGKSLKDPLFLRLLAVSLPIFTLLFLVLTRAPSTYFDSVLYRASWLHVLLATAMGVLLLSVDALQRIPLPRDLRLGILFLLGLGSLGFLLAIEPNLVRGPWIGIDPFLEENGRKYVPELRTAYTISTLCPPLISAALAATIGYIWAFKKGVGDKWLLATLLLLLAVTTFGTLFYALRMVRFIPPVSAPGLLLLARFLFEKLSSTPLTRYRVLREVLLLLLLGPLVGPPLFLAFSGHSFANSIFFFADVDPVKNDIKKATAYLEKTEQDPVLILDDLNFGPEILFRTTKHAVVGGGFYVHSKGTQQVLAFYTAQTSQDIATALEGTKADYVLVAQRSVAFWRPYLGLEPEAPPSSWIFDGVQEPKADILSQISHDQPPPFLEKVHADLGNVRLYKVRQDILKTYLPASKVQASN